MIEIEVLIPLIRELAQQELKPRFRHITEDYKSDGSIVTEADRVMQQVVQVALAARYPKIAFLGEEMEEGEQLEALHHPQGVWVLDPIDGTSNFSHGLPFYCVSLALIQHGEVQLGIVYDPERDECFHAVKGEGAFLNGERLNAPDHHTPLNRALAGVDFKRLPTEMAARLASQPPYASQRSFGAIALDWCWVAAGRNQVYLHGKHKLWDYAACWRIVEEAQGVSQTLEGEPVFTPTMEHKFAVVAVSQPLLEEWLAEVDP